MARDFNRIATAILVALLLAAAGQEQASADEAAEARVRAHLTGGDERVWVKTRWVQVLSEEAPRCEQGELWTFEQDGTGTRKVCENGEVRQQPLDWAWVGVQDGLPVVQVDDARYIVEGRKKSADLAGEPPVLVTVLRSLRTSQAEPVEEITLEFRER